jgi:hypothetical protein
MFRETQVIVTDTDTGAAYIKNVACPIPLYDIGQTVGMSDPDNPKGVIESEVIGVNLHYEVRNNVLESYVIYTLENKVEVYEQDIEYFYELDAEVEYERE